MKIASHRGMEKVTSTQLTSMEPVSRSASTISDASAGGGGAIDCQGLSVEIVNPLSDPEWDALLKSHDEAGVFHTSMWARVLHETYGHQPVYLRVSRFGSPQALIPLMEVRRMLRARRGVCLPFSDICPPLVVPGCNGALFDLVIGSLARERGWRFVDIRGGGGLTDLGEPSVVFRGHRLDLTRGTEGVWRGVKGSVRRAVRKAEKSGMNARIDRTEAGMRTFYHLHTMTRQRHGIPPQAFKFFKSIQTELIEKGHGFISIVEADRVPVAAMVFLNFQKHGMYKFGASNKAYQGFRPNNLAMWQGIQTLISAECETLHFGRSSLANDGLRRFKLSWNPVEEPVEYYRFDLQKEEWVEGKDQSHGLHTQVFRILPKRLNQLLGGLIYPHLD